MTVQLNDLPFKRFATKVDCSHNGVFSPEALKKWIDITASLGCNALMLYCEDTYQVEDHPYFGYGRGRYSMEELKALDRYALERGMELIPSIQTLSHLPTIFRWPQYTAINDTGSILLCDDEKTYALIDSMLSACRRCFTSRVIDLNMDPVALLGRGKHQSIHGYEPIPDIFQRHLETVCQLAAKHGFDTLLISGREACRVYASQERCCVGDVWVRNAFNPENHSSICLLRKQIPDAIHAGVENLILRFMGDDGCECSRFAGLPALFYASRIARGITDEVRIKEDFAAMFGIPWEDFLLLDLTQRTEKQALGVHPTRYILYNDPFLGLMDTTLPENTGADHEALCRLLAPLCDHPQWGYLFRTAYDLCAVTVEKWDIGMRIRSAYRTGDLPQLGQLAAQLRRIRDLVEAFYTSFRKQWMLENKAHGFDVSDVRLGGVMMRLKHCAQRLEAYAAGTESDIPELEEAQPDVRTPMSADYGQRKYLSYREPCSRLYCDIVSTNVLFKHRR